MALTKITAVACGVGLAILSASVAVTAARQSRGVGLKEINYVREPLTSILRQQGPLTLQQAKEELEARGFRDVGTPRPRGRMAVVGATAPRGERVTLVIDLNSGEIAGVRLLSVPDPKPDHKPGTTGQGEAKAAAEPRQTEKQAEKR